MLTSGQHLDGVTQRAFALWLLWLLLALSSFVRIEPAPYDVLGAGLFLFFFALGLRIPPGVGAPMFCLSIFVLANIVAAICASDPVHTFRATSIRFYMILSWFLFTCLIYENPQRVYDVIWSGYIFAAIIAVFFGVLMFFGILDIQVGTGREEERRAVGLFKDANVFGPYLVPVALFAFAKIIGGSGLRLLMIGALFLWFAFGILIGFSRGSWLNFGVSFVVAMALRLYTERAPAQLLRFLAVAGFLPVVTSLLVIFAISTNMGDIGELFQIRAKVQHSYDIARFATQTTILEHALVDPIGVGPGIAVHEGMFGIAPHNLFLHVLIESGWFGALAFYAFLAMTLWRGLNFCLQPTVIQDIYIIVFACTVGTLAQSPFVDSTHWRHMYLLFGMLWGPLLAWRADCAALRSGNGFLNHSTNRG